ncbi:proline-rich receptor-like protein kinase PERK9 [Iris pallida]|uniref:Proline-rich receptor-like protein kinase PERK9 n=1 Tax=Iris pallida TaxID=29817 RepID=A0AAX6E886_IRIPA|nr:proline-rich receptor-like protein kinase PERK9 [Iris pallida]KAJ6824261.1 proline-rich receptor-like protein kinase PERK9 [Iris pallida]
MFVIVHRRANSSTPCPVLQPPVSRPTTSIHGRPPPSRIWNTLPPQSPLPLQPPSSSSLRLPHRRLPTGTISTPTTTNIIHHTVPIGLALRPSLPHPSPHTSPSPPLLQTIATAIINPTSPQPQRSSPHTNHTKTETQLT